MHSTLLYSVEMERSPQDKKNTTRADDGIPLWGKKESSQYGPYHLYIISEIRSWLHGRMQLSVVGIFTSHTRGHFNSSDLRG